MAAALAGWPPRLRRGALAAAVLLPGLGAADGRRPTSPTGPVWGAVALLQAPGVSRCTAVAVEPHVAATAAHCLWNRALGRVVPAGSIHLLFGYDAGTYRQHLIPAAIRFASGAEPGSHDARGSDLALLTVEATLPVTLQPAAEQLPPGTAVALGGFGQDRAQRLFVDPDCRLEASLTGSDGQALVAHGCSGTHGDSGGALVATDAAGQPVLAGIDVAAWNGRAGGLAVPGAAVAALLAERR